MEKWYIHLHEWLISYGFHVGKYIILFVPWILWDHHASGKIYGRLPYCHYPPKKRGLVRFRCIFLFNWVIFLGSNFVQKNSVVKHYISQGWFQGPQKKWDPLMADPYYFHLKGLPYVPGESLKIPLKKIPFSQKNSPPQHLKHKHSRQHCNWPWLASRNSWRFFSNTTRNTCFFRYFGGWFSLI